MFIALVSAPYIGIGHELSWMSYTWVLDVNTEKRALEVLLQTMEEVDAKKPEVQYALQKYKKYKEDEYYYVQLHQVPKVQEIVYINEPGRGLNTPYKEFKI